MIEKENITLLVQGRVSTTFLDNIDNYIPFFNEIVYSTWSADVDYSEFDVELVVDELPLVHNKYNAGSAYYQCKSTLNGLEKVKTKYVLKHRTDEFVTNINKFLEYFSGKYLCCNYASMRINFLPYHISDHLFLAETERLYEVFSKLEKYLSYESDDEYGILNPKFGIEMLISMNYIATFGKYDIKYLVDSYGDKNLVFSIIKEYFDVFDINKLKPFRMMHNHRGRSYSDYDSNSGIQTVDDFIK